MIPDSPGAGSDLSGDGHIRPPPPPGRSTRAVSRVPAHSRPTNASQGGSRAPPRQGGVKKKRRLRCRAAPIPKGLPQRPQTRRPERPRSAFTAQLPQSGHAMPNVLQPLNTPIQSWSDRWLMGAPQRKSSRAPGGCSGGGRSPSNSKSAKAKPGPTQQVTKLRAPRLRAACQQPAGITRRGSSCGGSAAPQGPRPSRSAVPPSSGPPDGAADRTVPPAAPAGVAQHPRRSPSHRRSAALCGVHGQAHRRGPSCDRSDPGAPQPPCHGSPTKK